LKKSCLIALGIPVGCVIEAVYDIQPAGPGNNTLAMGYAPTVDLGDKGLLLTFAEDLAAMVDHQASQQDT
jgi:hypothetical protein